MAEVSIVQQGVDRFRDAVGSLEDEFQRVQKQVRARRKKLEKSLESRRKDIEKRTRKLRRDIERSEPVKRLEALRRDAGKQLEQGVVDVLGALQIASKHDVQRIDRKISQLNKKLKEMERAKRSTAKSPAGQASQSAA